jgi:hypothetical protein
LNALSNEFEKYKSETTIVLNELVDGYEIRNSQVRDNQLAHLNLTYINLNVYCPKPVLN